MTKLHQTSADDARAIADTFGPLSMTMLFDTPLSLAWRVNFLANFFTGPVYRDIGVRFGLSRPEFVILFCLSQEPGLVARDICLVTGLPKNSISRAVSELLVKGMISRKTNDADKRAKPLVLTAKGKQKLAQVVPVVEARQMAMCAPLSDAERAEFDRLYTKIIFGMPEWVKPD